MNTMNSSQEASRVECIVFVAAAAGLGRTAALANIALLLAGARKRVLIVDWSAEHPSAHRYFDRFGIGESPQVRALGELFDELTERRVGVWQAARFQPPGAIGPIDLVAPKAHGSPVPRLPWDDDPIDDIVQRLRRNIDSSSYDYVLVDAPTAPSEQIIDVIAGGADQAVVLFEPSQQSVDTAATMARALISPLTGPGVRVVPIEVELRDHRLRDRPVRRERSETAFRDVLPEGEWSSLRAPFDPALENRSQLATLADEPESEACRAYSQLAAKLTRGQVVGPPELPGELRKNYLAVLTGGDSPNAGHYKVVYAWPDRRYADWVRAALIDAGAEATLAGPVHQDAADRKVYIVSAALLEELPQSLSPGPEDLVLLVPGAPAGDEGTPSIDLCEKEPGQLRQLLLGRLGLVGDVPRRLNTAVQPRFPSIDESGPLATNIAVPGELPFTGRVTELAGMRDRLLSDIDGCRPYAVGGPPGIGKTVLVLEYLRLFGADYDLIWWISARTTELVRSGLAELADHLSLAGHDKVADVLGHLRTGDHRWLLIYDDAEDSSALRELLPVGGPGHVLITSRTVQEPDAGPRGGEDSGVALRPVVKSDGAALLRQRVDALAPRDAEEIAELLQGIPFALHLAASWLTEALDEPGAQKASKAEAAAFLATEYQERVERTLPEHGNDVIDACLAVTVRTLEKTDAERPLELMAVRLLELCAWLAPEGVSHELLSTVPFLTGLAQAVDSDDRTLLDHDSMLLDQLLHTCVRYGLGRMVWKRAPIFRMHRPTQELVRKQLEAASLADTRRDQVLEALGKSAPLAVTGPILDQSKRFAELSRHLGPAGAAESDNRWVRRWITEQTRYAFASGDEIGRRELLEVAERVMLRWPDADLYKGRLLGQMANIRRALRDFQGAQSDGKRALKILADQGGVWTHWILSERRGQAADLRGLGHYSEALGAIQGVYEQARLMYGETHWQTGLTQINLAESEFLMGRYQQARRTAEKSWQQRVEQFGPKDWMTLRIAGRLGDYTGATGDWKRARTMLATSLSLAQDAEDEKKQPPNREAVLGLMRSLAVAERYAVGLRSVRPHERIIDALNGMRKAFGRDHPSALATQLTLSVELTLSGNTAAALKNAQRCRDAFASFYSENHPFVQLCRIDLGAFLLEDGQDSQARTVLEIADEALEEALGERHPWTVAARLHQARALLGVGRLTEASERIEEVTESFELLDDPGPYTRMAECVREAIREGHAVRAGDPRTALYLDVPLI